MKFGIISIAIVLVLTGIIFSGCGGAGDDYTPGISQINQDIIGIMKITPSDVDAFFGVDFNKIREDADLTELYQQLLKRDYFDEEGSQMYGITFSDINTFVLAQNKAIRQNWAVTKGVFNNENIRQALTSMHFHYYEYEGIETWSTPGLYLGFYQEYLLFFQDYRQLEAITPTQQINGTSMYDDASFNAIIGVLPPGLGYSLVKNEYMDGQVSGLTVYKSEDKMLIRGWYRFPSEADAEYYITDIEQNLEALFTNCDIECFQQQHFIEIKGETNIDDCTASDFWKHYGLAF